MNSINLNEMVKVKLSDAGIEYYRRYMEEANKQMPEQWKFDTEPKQDKHFFTQFQLWDLMNIFGEFCQPCLMSPFVDNKIYFSERKEG